MRRHLLAWLVLSSAAAFWWPSIVDCAGRAGLGIITASGALQFDPLLVPSAETGQPVPRVSVGLVVAIIMFSIGTLLPREEIDQVLKGWPHVVAGTLVQYTSMPLLAVAFATLFRLPPDLYIGVVLVGCVPGAMASNVLTLAAGGNVSYSVSLTTLATLLSPIVVPLAMQAALHTQASIDALGISEQLLREVVGPVVAGHLVGRWGGRIASVLRRCAEPVANVAILWVIATVVALNRERLQQTPMTVLTVLLLVNAGGYLAGYGAAKALRLPEGMLRALTLEIGMQNAGVGTALTLRWFADQPAAAIPTAVYTFGCMLTGTMLAQWFAGRSAHAEASEVHQTEVHQATDCNESL
jgi:BASS family bile acid:Na+ symporter